MVVALPLSTTVVALPLSTTVVALPLPSSISVILPSLGDSQINAFSL